MPVARFQMPDGRIARFEVPEGTSPEQAQSMIAQSMGRQQEEQKPFNATDTMSTGQRFLAGIGQGMASGGRALLQGISKVTGAESVGAGLIKQRDIDEAKALDANLLATTAGRVGSGVGTAALAAPLTLVPGANTYAGGMALGALSGGALTEGDIADRAKAAAFGAAGAAGGKAIGDALGYAVPKIVKSMSSGREAARVANAQRDAAAMMAKDAGYVLPPSDVNPSMLNEALGGLSGKIKTAQVASQQNQNVTNALGRKALGIADDTPLTVDALRAIRSEASTAGYAPIRSAGEVSADSAYTKALDSIASQYQGAGRSFPGAAKNPVLDLVDGLRQPKFDAGDAIDMVKVLRETADKGFRTGDTGLAKAAKSAATALEDQLERHLTDAGNPAALTAFREARKTIAKSYTLEKALNSETGDVSAQVLAAQLKKGKPLSSELQTIAKIGAAFPKATQSLKEAPKALSPLDFATAIFGAGTTGPVGAAGLLARPAARSLLLSKPYQAAMASPSTYGRGLLETALPALNNEMLQRALPLSGGLLSANFSQQ